MDLRGGMGVHTLQVKREAFGRDYGFMEMTNTKRSMPPTIQSGSCSSFLIVFLLMILQSCSTSTQSTRSDVLLEKEADEVVVHMHDARTITFLRGEYHVVSTDSGKVISGMGRQFIDSLQGQTKPFTGTIPESAIQTIDYRGNSGGGSLVPLLMASGIVLLIFGITRIHISLGG